MPSKSKQQQKFFGIVRSIQKGDAPASKFSKQAKKAAKDMEKDDVKSYASTKHKGLPKKVNRESLESLENGIRNMVKEFMTESHHDKREGKMAKYDAKEIAQDAADVFKMIDKDMDLPEWLEAKITIAAHNMNSVKDYLTHHQPKNEGKLTEKVTGQYKVSPKVQMHWGMDKVVIISGNKRVVLNRKEMKSLMKGVKANKLGEGKLNEKVQRYVVGLDNGEVLSGDKSVTEKRALQIMSRISKRSDGWVNPFMIGVEAWNGTHPKSKGKPHKMNKKKIIVKEAGSLGGPISFGTDVGSNYIAPGRDTGVKNQGVYLQKFSSPEARSIIDGQLKMMAKELRKVQNKVIKTWMKGAKSGTIDFFDIIRGLKTGDARRAHPYETEFLVNVLTKDKIIDRFRSYFKGKKGKKR